MCNAVSFFLTGDGNTTQQFGVQRESVQGMEVPVDYTPAENRGWEEIPTVKKGIPQGRGAGW